MAVAVAVDVGVGLSDGVAVGDSDGVGVGLPDGVGVGLTVGEGAVSVNVKAVQLTGAAASGSLVGAAGETDSCRSW